MRKILDLDLRHLVYEFELCYIILLDLDWKYFGQQFIVTLIRYFTDAGLGNTLTINLNYNYILRDLDFRVPGLQIWFLIVIYLTTGLGLELGLQIWITTIKFYWIWT